MSRALSCLALAVAGVLLAADLRSSELPVDDWVRSQGGSAVVGPAGRIVSIDLSRSWVNDTDLAKIRGLESLEVLRLAQTEVTDAGLSIVESLPSLKELDLFFCEHVTDAGASQLRSAAGLQKLNLRGTKISGSGVKFLTELSRLQWLDLGIAEIDDPSIDLLEALPELRHLAIGGNRISEAGISSLRSLVHLRHLDLSGGQVTDSGIWAVSVSDLNLDEISSISGLESLNLSAPSPEYVAAISTGVPRLRGAIRVTDLGAAQLARLAGLRHLNLTRSAVTASGIEALAGLDRLEELVLAHGKGLGNEAGPALAGLKALKVLDVSYTRFGDEGLDSLNAHPSLQRVVAVGTPVSDAAAARFESGAAGRSVVR